MADDILSRKWDLQGSADPVLAGQAANLVRASMLARKQAPPTAHSDSAGSHKQEHQEAMPQNQGTAVYGSAEPGAQGQMQKEQGEMEETLSHVFRAEWDRPVVGMLGGMAESGGEEDTAERKEVEDGEIGISSHRPAS